MHNSAYAYFLSEFSIVHFSVARQ